LSKEFYLLSALCTIKGQGNKKMSPENNNQRRNYRYIFITSAIVIAITLFSLQASLISATTAIFFVGMTACLLFIFKPDTTTKEQEQSNRPAPEYYTLDSYCPTCGHVGKSKTLTKGSFIMEVIFWCLFIVPGIFYTVWRHASRQKVCSLCKNPAIIPADSPRAKKELAQ